MLQVFIDDSRWDNKFWALAGHCATKAQWDAFSAEWNQLVKNEWGLPKGRFRMNDAQAWTKELQAERLPKLYRIIEKHAVYQFAYTVEPAVLEEVMGDHPNRLFYDPYVFLAFRIIAFLTTKIVSDLGETTIEFTFDDQTEKRRIRKGFKGFRAEAPTDLAERIIGDPSFVKDDDCPPLQAADMLAWRVRRAYQETRDGSLKQWLRPGMIPQIPFQHYWWHKQRLVDLRKALLPHEHPVFHEDGTITFGPMVLRPAHRLQRD